VGVEQNAGYSIAYNPNMFDKFNYLNSFTVHKTSWKCSRLVSLNVQINMYKIIKGAVTQVSDEDRMKNLEIFRGGNFKYHIAQNSGGVKLWRISDFKVLARKSLANAQHLYYWQEKNFGELSFIKQKLIY